MDGSLPFPRKCIAAYFVAGAEFFYHFLFACTVASDSNALLIAEKSVSLIPQTHYR